MNKSIVLLFLTAFLLSAETLFQVKDSSNRVVLDVSSDGLRVLNQGDTVMVISSTEIKAVIDNSKALSRSFSVATSTSAKGQANVLEVTTGSTTMREGNAGNRYTDFSPHNIFLGLNAGASTTIGVPYVYSGLYNLYIGNYAGENNTSGYFNTFTGYMAGNSSRTSTHNTFYGYQAGMNNDTGSYNTAIGFQAGYEMSAGYNNNLIGYRAGFLTTSGHDNVYIGTDSGFSTSGGSYNVAMGYHSGRSISSGSSNIFMGYQSGYNNTIGNNNMFMGYQSGYTNTTGSNNQFMGYRSGQKNTSGAFSLFVGYQSGQNNTTGSENLFVGYHAGNANTTGLGNVCLGTYAGQVFTTGSENVMIGRGAGAYASTSASNNVFVGSYAGYGNGVNSGNVFLGYKVGYNNVGSNKLMIDNHDGANETTSLIYGDFATDNLVFNTSKTYVKHPLGTSNGLYIQNSGYSNYWHFYQYSTGGLHLYYNGAPRGNWDITSGAYTSVSDAKLKSNIGTLGEIKDKVLKLQPKRYNYTSQKNGERKYIGLIAQDVKELFPEFVYYNSEDDLYTMDYAGLSVVAIQAIKEQQAEIDELKAQINEIRQLIGK